MRSPVHLEHDESNGANYVWVAYIYWQKISDEMPQLDDLAFPTQGHAMQHYKAQIDGEWQQDKPGSKWWAYLKKNCAYNALGNRSRALRVELVQLLMVE